MPQNTNVNNNSAVVVVGRTAPVPTGQQSAEKSIPVVVASDQEAIPVEEQNKQQSEVALSLLGIPRSEVALGIFADVNTYDVNPSEWSATPEQTTTILPTERDDFAGIPGQQDWGLSHVPAEAGALIEAPPTETAVLTSKRFFRYQPGRVSAGTFGVKFGPSPYTTITTVPGVDNEKLFLSQDIYEQIRHPTIKKYGVFDNFDGYYFESINESVGDNLCCVRRTQSLIQQKSQYFFFNPNNPDNARQFSTKQYDDYGNMELPGQYYKYHGDAVILRDGLVNVHAGLFDPSLLKKKRTIGISEIDTDNWFTMDTVEQVITGFSYNNVTGRATVTTVGDHGYKNGDSITLKDILLSCNTGQKLYPNKYSRKFFEVESIDNSNNITIHVGISDKDSQPLGDGTEFIHDNATGGTIREVTAINEVGSNLNITGINRTSNSALREVGLLEITVDSHHGLLEGDHIHWTTGATWGAPESGVWPDIAGTNNQKLYQVRYVKNSRTFTIQIGDPAFSELDVDAEWVSGGIFKKVEDFTKASTSNIQTVSYTPSTGKLVINTGGAIANLSAGDTVELADISTTCSYGNKVYPAKDDEDTFPIINVTSNTFQFDLFESTIVHVHEAAALTGRTSNFGLRLGSGIYYYNNGVEYGESDRRVDGGIYYVNQILGNRIKISYNPENGLLSPNETGVFKRLSSTNPVLANQSGADYEYKLTPTTSSTYDPTTGEFTLDFGVATSTLVEGGIQEGDKIRIDDFSIGIDCSTPYANNLTVTEGQFVVNNGLVYEAVNDGTTAAAGSGPTGTGTGITDGTVVFDFKTDEQIKYYPRPYNAAPDGGRPPKDPPAGKFLTVIAVTANTCTVQVLPQIPSTDINQSNIVYVSLRCVTVEKARPYIITPAPFILPESPTLSYRGQYDETDKSNFTEWINNAFGAFPYQYEGQGTELIGYINTDVIANTEDGALSLKNDIDFVNNKLLKEWVYNHVDPRYWTVYEYRVPRSRFSGEKIDGQENQDVVYSDVVYSSNSQNFPGQEVIDPATSSPLTRTSNWNLNPQNVTMYKIEFSWYGAVGALFLAYVPLDNGEARWVRVHHLRASNQLKVSSLGNPTLPITYLVYGGGTERSYGYENNKKAENYIANSNSYSEFLVKYGASYYIDGGDRGTVRLFNYATPIQENIYGNKLNFNILDAATNNFGDGDLVGGDPLPHLKLTGGGIAVGDGVANNVLSLTADQYSFYIGATVVTPIREPNVKITWVDGANGKVYLSRPINSSTTGVFSIILDRPKLLIGLKCREEVNSVRNRIQVYPTRLSIGNTGNFASIKLIKSPKFQTKDPVRNDFTTGYTIGTALNIGSIGKATPLDSTLVNNSAYLEELGSTFGYFRGFFEGNSSIVTVFGKLSRDASGIYFFSADEKTNANLLIYGDFLRAGEYLETNPNTINGSDVVPTDTPLAALSAISINDERRTPIPGTGQQITTLYTPSNSGEQFELQQFFDYNKDYLSFPLTNEIETLYVAASENSNYDSTNPSTSITAAITWEEQ
jgi:hypothetical protein